jgi:hypothetical protein
VGMARSLPGQGRRAWVRATAGPPIRGSGDRFRTRCFCVSAHASAQCSCGITGFSTPPKGHMALNPRVGGSSPLVFTSRRTNPLKSLEILRSDQCVGRSTPLPHPYPGGRQRASAVRMDACSTCRASQRCHHTPTRQPAWPAGTPFPPLPAPGRRCGSQIGSDIMSYSRTTQPRGAQRRCGSASPALAHFGRPK